jgi:hypothetical protein
MTPDADSRLFQGITEVGLRIEGWVEYPTFREIVEI